MSTLRGPVSVRHCTKENAEVLKLGQMTAYIFEDGSHTDTRVGCITFTLPKGVKGPPMHWHRFHDECFLVTKGTVRFNTPDGSSDAKPGDCMVVPPRSVHTFENPSQTEDAEMFMTSTPGHYIDYFRMLAKSAEEGKTLTPAGSQHLMALFGTFPPDVESEP